MTSSCGHTSLLIRGNCYYLSYFSNSENHHSSIQSCIKSQTVLVIRVELISQIKIKRLCFLHNYSYKFSKKFTKNGRNFCFSAVTFFCVENRENFLLSSDRNMVFPQILSHIPFLSDQWLSRYKNYPLCHQSR